MVGHATAKHQHASASFIHCTLRGLPWGHDLYILSCGRVSTDPFSPMDSLPSECVPPELQDNKSDLDKTSMPYENYKSGSEIEESENSTLRSADGGFWGWATVTGS